MTDPKQVITLSFTVEEVNGILSLLAELPYMKVTGLIQEIQMQAAPQVAAKQEEEKAE